MTGIEFSDKITVKLIRAMASDNMVVQAAQVSSKGENNPDTVPERLIRALMAGKHGCYDDKTEVLTSQGWKKFPDVTGEESFLTLDIESNKIAYSKASRVVRERYVGEMIQVSAQQVDLLVTPDHRMLGEARTSKGWGSHTKTFPAHELEERCHRLPLGGGVRDGETISPARAELLGFIIADGNVHKNKVSFHLRKTRKIEWLKARAKVTNEREDWYALDNSDLPDGFLELAKATYTSGRDRTIPRKALTEWSGETIGHLIDGYLEGDGSVGDHGQVGMSTVSAQLADDLQEAAALAGGAISYQRLQTDRESSFGDRPMHHLGFIGLRNSRPRIGWTTKARAREVRRVDYDGTVYCVTVPSGVIRVRRNGKSLWCGNSPFEHNAFTFFVEAPIFVFREWQRHRMCLAGDTIITLTSPHNPNNIRYRDMASLWENWHLGVADNVPRKRKPSIRVRRKGFMVQTLREDPQPGETKYIQEGPFATRAEAELFVSDMPETWRRRKLPSARRQFAVSVREDDGATLTQRIADIKKSGVQEVFLVKTTRGDSIKATANHPFLTPTGYQKVEELRVGSEVMVSGTRGVSNPDPMVSKELRMGVGHWTYRMRKNLLPAGGTSACAECAEQVDNGALELDHVVPVVLDISLALTESNLQPLCKPCHRTKTTFEQRYRRGGSFVERGGVSAVIESIESCGMEETYDIEMEGEFPNFIANNFVVHNSSFNEMSGRYTELLPKFYVPGEDRPMVNRGTKMRPDMVYGDDLAGADARAGLEVMAEYAWDEYQAAIGNGIAHEVARMVLPVNIYSQMYWTVNARSLLNFLSLRVESDDSLVRSYPQLEIEYGAAQVEALFAEQMPATYAAFVAGGRVAP